jgi:peptidoglycan LD-endopeptidase LytH
MNYKTTYLILFLSFFRLLGNEKQDLLRACNDFDILNSKVRDGIIVKELAERNFVTLIINIKKLYNLRCKTIKYKWSFPVEGYGKKSIGGTNGEGYKPGGYNYFDGNKHKGHPAHDIFIYDTDFNCIDDKTNKKVNVLSASTGIVVALEKSWSNTSYLRGGKYVWVYEPIDNNLFYYAHNDSLFVNIGDFVESGTPIAFVGRSGLNANKKRSPTHLHFMVLKLEDSYLPKPINSYELLLESIKR